MIKIIHLIWLSTLIPILVNAEPVVVHSIPVKDLSIDLVAIPAGQVTLGDIDGQRDETPRVKLQIKAFYLQQHEVTLGLFERFVDQNPGFQPDACWVYQKEKGWTKSTSAYWKQPGYAQTQKHPVACVSWNNVQAFIRWLNQTTHKSFRLPSEAEWEYAARARSQHRYYWGPNPTGLCHHANASDLQTLKRFPSFKSNTCDDGFLEAAPVKQFLPNPYGLYDIYGNVWEWTEDCWNPHYHDMTKEGLPVLTGDCERRVFRGGGWGDNPNFARSGLRNRGYHDRGKDDVGFRLVLDSLD